LCPPWYSLTQKHIHPIFNTTRTPTNIKTITRIGDRPRRCELTPSVPQMGGGWPREVSICVLLLISCYFANTVPHIPTSTTLNFIKHRGIIWNDIWQEELLF
jgi:hypothetical protein